VFWSLVHRTIFYELFKVFCVTLVAITSLILLAGIISEAMKNGFGPAQIAACVPLLLPSTLPYTLPTATLFATCIVYGRLSADNEILALKSAGVHIMHVAWPALLLGAITSAVTAVAFIDLIPTTGCLLRNQVVSDVDELLYTMLRKDGYIKHPNIAFEINVKSVQGRKLQDAIFKRRAANGFDVIAVAKEAELRVDLVHRQILVHMRQCQMTQGAGQMLVDDKIWPVDIPKDWTSPIKSRPMDMTWSELFEYEEKAQREKEKISRDIELQLMQEKLGKPMDPNYLKDLYAERQYRDRMIFGIHAEWSMRPALALGCLCFALVGCPVGIWFSKSDYLSAFITCFLPIVIVYYPSMFCLFDLARAGKIPPWLGIFNADLLILFTGVLLFRRLARN
jgi:lipopolysaccharide export system permease protein